MKTKLLFTARYVKFDFSDIIIPHDHKKRYFSLTTTDSVTIERKSTRKILSAYYLTL